MFTVLFSQQFILFFYKWNYIVTIDVHMQLSPSIFPVKHKVFNKNLIFFIELLCCCCRRLAWNADNHRQSKFVI